jgi:hypothetical protein
MKNQPANNPVSEWVPEFSLDLALASGQKFQDLVEAFNESTKALAELPPLKLKNGWASITPEIAEALLRRNRPGANRKASLATILYYASQMHAGLWPKTGQPIILTVDGVLIDGQHRLWAAYLGHVTFDSFVVTDVPTIDHVFAYIDNGKARNAAAALQTAGLNGLSPLISQTIQITFAFEAGLYTCGKKRRAPRMAPVQVLNYLERCPDIRKAAHLVAGEHKDACEVIGHRDVTAFVAYKIIALHNEEVCDRFMEEISYADENRSDNDPLKALRTYLVKQSKSEAPASKHVILAHVIKAFNAWVTETPMKRVAVATDDPFPQFAEAVAAPVEEPELV